jgi:EAL domain-containing protein (putative c-di-GMP-specific phosphodiesterase class I)
MTMTNSMKSDPRFPRSILERQAIPAPEPDPAGSDERLDPTSRDPAFESFRPRLCVRTGRITAIEILSPVPGARTKQDLEERWQWDQGIVVASAALKTLMDNGHLHVGVCVSVPWTWIEDVDAVSLAIQVIRDAEMAPYNLIVQISDDAPLVDLPSATAGIAALSRHGVEVCLSNFGSARHAHHLLRSLPVTSVRLDAALVATRRGSSRDTVVLRSLLDMLHQMNVTVTVDGVHHQEDLAFVTREQADVVQGDFIAPPIRLDLLISWLNTTNRLAASRTLNTLQWAF